MHLKVALFQMEVQSGLPRRNLNRVLSRLDEAKAEADLILLPEMAMPGYLIGDLWERMSFIREVLSVQGELVRASKGTAIAFGGLGIDENKKNEDGRVRKYNAFFLAVDGKLSSAKNSPYPFSLKTLMPNYREFDDSRHFYDLQKLSLELGVPVEDLINPHPLLSSGREWKVGGTLCEDAWSDDYNIDPIDILCKKGADVLVNLSCSPFTLLKNNKRNRVFSAKAKKAGLPLYYCNSVGIQNNGKSIYTFDGSSTVYSAKGEVHTQLASFREELLCVNVLEEKKDPPSIEENSVLLKALEYGTKKFVESCGVNRVVIGLSGGVDSALAASIYQRALGSDRVHLINMPSQYNSTLTKSAAKQLAERLSCPYAEVGIQDSVNLTLKQMEELSFKSSKGSTKLSWDHRVVENIQARDRSSRILSAVAAALGGVFTCNANKSELCVGYGTLYGDLGGFLANLADLWKYQIYDLCREINGQGEEVIPQAILEMKPSAELSENQNPEKGQGDPLHYPYHDALFRSWVENWNRLSPEEILESYLLGELEKDFGLNENELAKIFPTPRDFLADLEKWWKLYNSVGLFKRIQAPPVLAFSRRAFGFDHRESQLGCLGTEKYLKLKTKIL